MRGGAVRCEDKALSEDFRDLGFNLVTGNFGERKFLERELSLRRLVAR